MLITSGQQYELLDWLKETTFPMEARFADVDFARQAYDLIVKRIINSGVLDLLPLQGVRLSILIRRRPLVVIMERCISKPPRYSQK